MEGEPLNECFAFAVFGVGVYDDRNSLI